MSMSGGVDRGRVVGRRMSLLTCGLLLAVASFPAASMASGWSSTGATLPANAAANTVVSLGQVSCGSAGDCGAVGTYGDTSNGQDGLLVTETAGIWQPAVEAEPPAGALARPFVTVSSVSCPAAGSCSAVGEYADSSNHRQGMLLTESSGMWQSPGVIASLPANASVDASVLLSSVSCVATGECAAVGSYLDSGGNTRGLLLTESAGVWGTGVQAIVPANAGSSGLALTSVSCTSAGNCSAVGKYRDSSGDFQGLLLTETAGTWQPGIEASLPANAASNPGVTLSSVSCAAAGECSAVGTYTDGSSNGQGLLLIETAGVWQPAVEASTPANALGSGQDIALGSVSCGAAGDCSAVGTYIDSSNATQGLLVTESAGAWQPGTEASLPANAQSSPFVRLGSVSCVSSGECTAVGRYADTGGNSQELWVTESSGTWGTGVEATPPANAGSDPDVLLSSVSCVVGARLQRRRHLPGRQAGAAGVCDGEPGRVSVGSVVWGSGRSGGGRVDLGVAVGGILTGRDGHLLCVRTAVHAAVELYQWGDDSGHSCRVG